MEDLWIWWNPNEFHCSTLSTLRRRASMCSASWWTTRSITEIVSTCFYTLLVAALLKDVVSESKASFKGFSMSFPWGPWFWILEFLESSVFFSPGLWSRGLLYGKAWNPDVEPVAPLTLVMAFGWLSSLSKYRTHPNIPQRNWSDTALERGKTTVWQFLSQKVLRYWGWVKTVTPPWLAKLRLPLLRRYLRACENLVAESLPELCLGAIRASSYSSWFLDFYMGYRYWYWPISWG